MDWQSTWSCKHFVFLKNKSPFFSYPYPVELVISEPGNLYHCVLSLEKKMSVSSPLHHAFPWLLQGELHLRVTDTSPCKKSPSLFLAGSLQVLESCCEVAQRAVQLDLEDSSWSGQLVPVSCNPHHKKNFLPYVQSKPILFGPCSFIIGPGKKSLPVFLRTFICLGGFLGEETFSCLWLEFCAGKRYSAWRSKRNMGYCLTAEALCEQQRLFYITVPPPVPIGFCGWFALQSHFMDLQVSLVFLWPSENPDWLRKAAWQDCDLPLGGSCTSKLTCD